MKIWLAYGHPTNPIEIPLDINEHCTVAWAIRHSGLLERFPTLSMQCLSDSGYVGIYGRRVSLDTVLTEGDRVEIYCSLQIDPKEARRRRASKSTKS